MQAPPSRPLRAGPSRAATHGLRTRGGGGVGGARGARDSSRLLGSSVSPGGAVACSWRCARLAADAGALATRVGVAPCRAAGRARLRSRGPVAARIRVRASSTASGGPAIRRARLLLRHSLHDLVADGARLARGHAAAHAVRVFVGAPCRARRGGGRGAGGLRVRVARLSLVDAVLQALGDLHGQRCSWPACMLALANRGRRHVRVRVRVCVCVCVFKGPASHAHEDTWLRRTTLGTVRGWRRRHKVDTRRCRRCLPCTSLGRNRAAAVARPPLRRCRCTRRSFCSARRHRRPRRTMQRMALPTRIPRARRRARGPAVQRDGSSR